MKKLIAFVLSLVMTAALAVPSTAAGPGAVSTTRVAASAKMSHYSLAQMTGELFLRSGAAGSRGAEHGVRSPKTQAVRPRVPGRLLEAEPPATVRRLRQTGRAGKQPRKPGHGKCRLRLALKTRL